MKKLVFVAVVAAVLVPASMALADPDPNTSDGFFSYTSLPGIWSDVINHASDILAPGSVPTPGFCQLFNYSSYANGKATIGFSGGTGNGSGSPADPINHLYPNSWGDLTWGSGVTLGPKSAVYPVSVNDAARQTFNATTVITYRQHINDMYALDINGHRLAPQRANGKVDTGDNGNSGNPPDPAAVGTIKDGVGDSPSLVYQGTVGWAGNNADMRINFGAVSATKAQMWLGGYWFDNNYRPGSGWDGTNPYAGAEFNFNLAQAVAAGGVNLDTTVTSSTITVTVSDATGQKASISCANPFPLADANGHGIGTWYARGGEVAASVAANRAWCRKIDPNTGESIQYQNYVTVDNMSVCMSAFGNVTDHAGKANYADIDAMATFINSTPLANRSGGLANLKYNLNGDNVVDSADRLAVIQAAGGKNEADFTLDNKVDVKDLQAWLAGSASGGTLTGFANGDGNGDGKVDVKDLQLWLAASTSDIQPAGITATPEPATMTLLGLGVVAMLRRRK